MLEIEFLVRVIGMREIARAVVRSPQSVAGKRVIALDQRDRQRELIQIA